MVFEGLAGLQVMTGDGSSLQSVSAHLLTIMRESLPRVSRCAYRDACGKDVGDMGRSNGLGRAVSVVRTRHGQRGLRRGRTGHAARERRTADVPPKRV